MVILRVRGADDAGATLIDVLETYAQSLRDVDSKLMLVTDNERVIRQLRVTGATDVIGTRNVYRSSAFIGESTRHAYDDALAWVESNREEAESVTRDVARRGMAVVVGAFVALSLSLPATAGDRASTVEPSETTPSDVGARSTPETTGPRRSRGDDAGRHACRGRHS